MKLYSLSLCWVFISVATSAQVIPSKPLNDRKTFEVSACKPSKKAIIAVWGEDRANRKVGEAKMRVGYSYSKNNGKIWTEKQIIDSTWAFANGNPYVTCNEKGETFLAVMHIDTSFFAGNLTLYQFDFKTKRFKKKSIPAVSEYHLLDKPALLAIGNEIHLAYVAVGSPVHKKPGALRYQVSKDKGATWSAPVDVVSEKEVPVLGASLALGKNNEVFIGCGSYGRFGMFLIKKKNLSDSIAFEKPIVVSAPSTTVRSGISELWSDKKHGLVMTWHYPHMPNQVWLSYSKDNGDSWATPLSLTSTGNLISARFDASGNISCIYSDYGNKQFEVKYKQLNKDYKVLQEKWLMKPVPMAERKEYIGAFQQLLSQGKKLFAFWIDYTNNNTLKFAKWD